MSALPSHRGKKIETIASLPRSREQDTELYDFLDGFDEKPGSDAFPGGSLQMLENGAEFVIGPMLVNCT